MFRGLKSEVQMRSLGSQSKMKQKTENSTKGAFESALAGIEDEFISHRVFWSDSGRQWITEAWLHWNECVSGDKSPCLHSFSQDAEFSFKHWLLLHGFLTQAQPIFWIVFKDCPELSRD